MLLSEPVKEVAVRADRRRIEDNAVHVALKAPLTGILRHGVADLGLKASFGRLARCCFSGLPRRKVRKVEGMARLLKVRTKLRELVEYSEILVLQAELRRPIVGVNGFVPLPSEDRHGTFLHGTWTGRGCTSLVVQRLVPVGRAGHQRVEAVRLDPLGGG